MEEQERELEVLNEGRDELEELNVCCTGSTARK